MRAASSFTNAIDAGNRALRRGKTAERADLLGATSADVASALRGPATSASGALDRALIRSRGLSRLLSAHSNEFDSQLLRDRVSAVARGRSRQAMGLGLLSQAAGMDKRLSDAARMTKWVRDEARANTLGSLAGIGLGLFANRGTMFPRRTPADPAGGPAAPPYNPMTGSGALYA